VLGKQVRQILGFVELPRQLLTEELTPAVLDLAPPA
jgi:hypothetical protein